MATYINHKHNGEVETIDEFDTRREARKMINEYYQCSFEGDIYLSTRCTKDWADSSKTIGV